MMELMIVARKAVPELQLEHGLAVDRVYTGSFMTSLDMAGMHFSLGGVLDVMELFNAEKFFLQGSPFQL